MAAAGYCAMGHGCGEYVESDIWTSLDPGYLRVSARSLARAHLVLFLFFFSRIERTKESFYRIVCDAVGACVIPITITIIVLYFRTGFHCYRCGYVL
jgi:hypothetical protein